MINEVCDQLLQALESAGSPLPSYFQPGISRQYVDDTFEKNNVTIKLPEEVYALYQWRNGLDDDTVSSMAFGEIALFTLATFPSLQLSIENYKAPHFRNSPWAEGLFPIFDNGLGDVCLIDTNVGSRTYKMIMLHSPSNPYIENCASIFDSLETCLATVIECYQKKVYYYLSDSPFLEIDPKREMGIWAKNNPRSEYYKIMENS